MNNSLKELIVSILNDANEKGYNAETEYDRQLFAQFLIEHGVYIMSCDLVQDSSLLNSNISIDRLEQPCELGAECEYFYRGNCSKYGCPIDEVDEECKYFKDYIDEDIVDVL